MPQKLTHKEFVTKASDIHGDKYEYIEEYKGSQNKIKILCKKHNYIFEQTPNKHLIGRGCPLCGRNIEKENITDYIIDFNKIHKNSYNYSLNDSNKIYSTNSKIKIQCKRHNYTFEQTIFKHLKGHGCKKCALEDISKSKKDSIEEYIKKANSKHNYKYTYNINQLNNHKDTIEIVCPEHGIFYQKANTHLRSKIGCPDCKKIFLRKKRIKELEINFFKGYQVIPNYNPKGCELFDKISKEKGIYIQHAMNGGEYYIKELGYWVDGYDKENNIVYEYDEKRHFSCKNKYIEKDIKRQKEITNFLKCKFIRIKD